MSSETALGLYGRPRRLVSSTRIAAGSTRRRPSKSIASRVPSASAAEVDVRVCATAREGRATSAASKTRWRRGKAGAPIAGSPAGFTTFRLRGGDLHSAWAAIDPHSALAFELSFDQERRERVDDLRLDRAFQRSRAVDRIVAFL